MFSVQNMKIDKLQTLVGFLALPFFIIYPILSVVMMDIVENIWGIWARIAVGIFALAVLIIFICALWRCFHRLDVRFRGEMREQFRGIYRIMSLPTDKKNIRKPEGAEIKIGDYGWEAQPFRKNGLIYLQGLNETWHVVWHAGFRPDQIEYVGPKPVSQYDWNDFEFVAPNKPASPRYRYGYCTPKNPCPFPVEARHNMIAMGFPN
jgi:hypothetical protein